MNAKELINILERVQPTIPVVFLDSDKGYLEVDVVTVTNIFKSQIAPTAFTSGYVVVAALEVA